MRRQQQPKRLLSPPRVRMRVRLRDEKTDMTHVPNPPQASDFLVFVDMTAARARCDVLLYHAFSC